MAQARIVILTLRTGQQAEETEEEVSSSQVVKEFERLAQIEVSRCLTPVLHMLGIADRSTNCVSGSASRPRVR